MDIAQASIAEAIGEFVEAHYTFHPHRAIWDGRHEHDGTMPDYSRSAVAGRIAALERWSLRLRGLAEDAAGMAPEGAPRSEAPAEGERDHSPLVSQAERDLALVEHACADELFRWRDWRPHERNPGFYHGLLDLSIYVKRPYAPPGERFEALIRHLGGVTNVLRTARENLRLPLARPAIEQAIHAYKGLANYYGNQLRAAGAAMTAEPGRLSAFHAAIVAATDALYDFIAFLREQMAQASRDFHLGAERLAAMVRYGELVDLPVDRLLKVGQDDLARNHARAEEVAGRLGHTTAEAFARLGRERRPGHEILATTAHMVAELRDYLASSGTVDVSDLATCHVVATPSFMRAGAAFMDAPGPFERPDQPAYFYVTLPDPAWPPAVQADWLAKLNPWGLRNTAAHEAYPGHLLHFLHLARHPSVAARAFTSYACVEGWAHYAEQLLIEVGYGGEDPRAELAQVGMALLRDCRYLTALNLHCGEVTIQQAAEFIAAQTHLAPIRCHQEAQRGAQDPGYLYYALGKLMLLKLREDYRRQEGQRYTMRRFHDAFLSCGAPPLPLARRMLLCAPGGAPV